MRETAYKGKNYPEPDRDTQRAVAAGGINLFRYFPEDRLIIVAEVTMEKFSCKRFYSNMPQSFADEMVCEHDKAAFFKMYQAIDEGEKKATAVFRMKDGITYVRVVLSVLDTDENGNAKTVVGMVEDVTAEIIREKESKNKELEQKAQLREALVKSERYKNAVLADAITVYEVNLTKNVIEDEIWEAIDGKNIELLALVGLSVPADYDVFLERWTAQQVASEYKELYEKEANREYLLKQFEEGHTEFATELFVTMGTGRKIYVRHTIFLAQDEGSGDIIAYCNVKNITEQKLRELQMRQYEQLFVVTAANIYTGILQVEMETHITKRIMLRDGKIAVKDAGYWEEYLEDQLPFVHPNDLEAVTEALNIQTFRHIPVNEKRIFSYKSITKNKEDRYKSFFTTIYMTEIDNRKYGVIVTIDNTNTVERELRQKKLIEDALARAEAANKAKTSFLSNMSHDIRTPMNAVIGFTTLATTHIDQKEQVRDYLGKIMSASNHLLNLINDILDMSRIESGRMQLEEAECSLTEIAEEIQNILQADMKAKGLNFHVDTADIYNEKVICDKLRLNQILLNLLGNAVKFTEPGGTVSVRIRQRPGGSKEYGKYEFHVKDNGIGMSKEFLAHIFEPFERERTSTISGIQGTGLGMAITKNIVELMGGTIAVKSRKGEGTEFIIVIPMKEQASEKEKIRDRGPEGVLPDPKKKKNVFGKEHMHGQRVLLVEDIDLNREIACELLTEAGFVMEEAENGRIALDKLIQKGAGYYSLVLMDIQMPVMDGYSAAKAIRALKDKELAEIPIIAMTADAFEEDRKKAMEAGMDAHVAKPIEVDKLFETLERILDRKNE